MNHREFSCVTLKTMMMKRGRGDDGDKGDYNKKKTRIKYNVVDCESNNDDDRLAYGEILVSLNLKFNKDNWFIYSIFFNTGYSFTTC